MNIPRHTVAPFDEFKILDYEHKEIPITRDIPSGCERYVLPGSKVYSATGHPGTFLFQEIVYPDYTFWISNYFTVAKEKVFGKISRPSLEIHFILLNNFLYRLKGFDWQVIEESQYNLLSIPYVENEVYFDNKDYFTFDIHPSRKILEKISSDNPGLKNFLKKVEEGYFVQFFDTPVFASPKVLFLIKRIIGDLRKGEPAHPNLDEVVQELISLALAKPYESEYMHFNYFHIESICQAKKRMINHMDDSKILEKEINASPINSAKFRHGFQQIFDERPHEYLRRRRMEKARYLFKRYPHSRVKDVAMEVGYSNPNYFSTIYKHFFGITPLESKR